MSHVVGIDFDTHAVHLVRLDENEPRAEYLRVELAGKTAWDRAIDVQDVIPPSQWWEDVYLVAIESPKSNRFDTAVKLARVQGAVIARLPLWRLEVWEVTPHDWKSHLGIKLTEKPSPFTFARTDGRFDKALLGWSQDALDALGIALYARDVNARAIEQQLAKEHA